MSDPIFAANQRVQETFKCFEAAVAVSSELRLDESGAPEARAKESETLGAFFAACEEMTLRRREEKAPPWRTGLRRGRHQGLGAAEKRPRPKSNTIHGLGRKKAYIRASKPPLCDVRRTVLA